MSAFFVAGASTAGLVGRLGDMWGKRRILIAVLSLFSIGAAGCAASSALPLLILGRVVMGCAAGLFPLAFSIIRDELPPDRVSGGLALTSSSIGLGGAVGLILGGAIADSIGFRWIFVMAAVMGVTALLAVIAFVPESPVRVPGRVDVVGAVLMALGLAAPLIAIGLTPTWGWLGPETLALIALGVAILAVFVAHERRHDQPLLYLPGLMRRDMALTNLATVCAGFGMFGSSVIMLQFFQVPASAGYGPGASAAAAGLFVLPGAILVVLTAPVAGQLTRYAGPRVTLMLGCGISAAATALLAFEHDYTFLLFLWPTLVWIGIGLAFGAMPALVLAAAPQERSGQATGVNLIARLVGSSLGVQAAASFVTASVGASGVATEAGFRTALLVQAGGAFAAMLLAFMIPVRHVRVRTPIEPATPTAP